MYYSGIDIVFIFVGVINLWRRDGRCGKKNKLPNGTPGQCDPNVSANKKGPCCSSKGWCGNTKRHCKCKGCKDFRTKGEKTFFDIFLHSKLPL